jgi:hypothetical protein
MSDNQNINDYIEGIFYVKEHFNINNNNNMLKILNFSTSDIYTLKQIFLKIQNAPSNMKQELQHFSEQYRQAEKHNKNIIGPCSICGSTVNESSTTDLDGNKCHIKCFINKPQTSQAPKNIFESINKPYIHQTKKRKRNPLYKWACPNCKIIFNIDNSIECGTVRCTKCNKLVIFNKIITQNTTLNTTQNTTQNNKNKKK